MKNIMFIMLCIILIEAIVLFFNIETENFISDFEKSQETKITKGK